MEEKLKFLFEKILERTVKKYNQYNDSRVKIESTPTIDLVNKVKTHRGSKYEVYVKIPELKVFSDFTHIFHKIWKTMGLHNKIETNLFINTIIPKNFDTLKYKANQYKQELQEEVDKYVKRQRVVGNEISINIDDVEVINNNWVGGYRMSFSVYATCINNGNQEEILRVDNPIIEKELNYICTELLGHEYMDGIIQGYGLTVDFVKNETKKNDVPYDETITEGEKVRVFSESVDTEELKWHRDREDRLVEVIESSGWELQFDNELPFKLKKGMSVIIPEGVYHRVIKGNGNLKVSITILD